MHPKHLLSAESNEKHFLPVTYFHYDFVEKFCQKKKKKFLTFTLVLQG